MYVVCMCCVHGVCTICVCPRVTLHTSGTQVTVGMESYVVVLVM